MKRKINKLEIIGVVRDKINANHDVIVELSDGGRYVATFFTLTNIQYLMSYYKHISAECNSGSFFWSSDMCIIEILEESVLVESITEMLNGDYFENVFRKL